MTKDNDISNAQVVKSPETNSGATVTPNLGKIRFVEPELSAPVDVLEATSFFQIPGDSGDTET